MLLLVSLAPSHDSRRHLWMAAVFSVSRGRQCQDTKWQLKCYSRGTPSSGLAYNVVYGLEAGMCCLAMRRHYEIQERFLNLPVYGNAQVVGHDLSFAEEHFVIAIMRACTWISTLPRVFCDHCLVALRANLSLFPKAGTSLAVTQLHVRRRLRFTTYFLFAINRFSRASARACSFFKVKFVIN